MYSYPYPRPAVTVDLVAFARTESGPRVLVVKRKHDPFAGRWAIPGGFLEMDETGAQGARRELREETGLDVSGPISFVGVFDDPHRDPRGRTISLAHATVVPGTIPQVSGGDDAAEATWLDPQAPLELAFDHAEILAAALAWLDREVKSGEHQAEH